MQHARARLDDGRLLIGLSTIGRLFGRSRWTIKRWIDREAFPAAKLPNGSWITDPNLIRGWILARHRLAQGISSEDDE